MRELNVERITEAVASLCIEANHHLDEATRGCLAARAEEEAWPSAKAVLSIIEKNIEIAAEGEFPLCQDTGYVGSPIKKKCACRLKLEQQDLVEAGRINEREAFSGFREDIYPDEASRKEGKTICVLCQRFADALPAPKFPQLLLFGQAGRGKSFMGNAIAARAIERGIDTLRLTAYRMTEEVMNGFSNNASPLPRFTQVPLLVLDDLGTEPLIPNVTKESLFAIADQRNTSRLATVYISNLNADELTERYGERIASRITDASITKAIRFTGDSLRGSKEKNR